MANQNYKFVKRCTNLNCDNNTSYPVRKGTDAINASHAEDCPDCGYNMTAMLRAEREECEYDYEYDYEMSI